MRACFRCSILLLLCLPACTVLKYPRTWDGGPLPGSSVTSDVTSDGTSEVPGEQEREPETLRAPEDMRAMLQFARALVGTRGPLRVGIRSFPFDCSGYVAAVYALVDAELMTLEPDDQETGLTGTEIIYRRTHAQGRLFKRHPRPGDLVFFDNTWDRDSDGRLNDALTHIGLVDRIRRDGTLEILHLGNTGIGHLRMNLKRRGEARDEETGEVLNDPLRRRTSSDEADTPYLSAQLFRAFGRLE